MKFRLILATYFLAGLAAADTLTFTITGTGSGTIGSQTFSNSHFTLTFTSDTNSIATGTSCCSSARTTPAGTPGYLAIDGIGSGSFGTGDQAIFSYGNGTVGIWHYNSPEFLTITNSTFAGYDLTTNIGPAGGTTFSYATPIATTLGNLSFSSVSGVTFAGQRASGGGTPSAVSVSPASGASSVSEVKTFSFVVSDTAGVSDLQGMDILYVDPAATSSERYTCWAWYDRSANTIYLNQGSTDWSVYGPIGGAGPFGPNPGGRHCRINTSSATVTASGNNLTLTLPITLAPADSEPTTLQVYVDAVNNAGQDSGYQQVGTWTVNPTATPGFTMSVAPVYTPFQGIPVGGSAQYTVTVTGYGGFNDTVTLANASQWPGGATPPTVTINPTTITGSGSATVTVTSNSSTTPSLYGIVIRGSTPTITNETGFQLAIANAPPTVSVYPYPGTGSSQVFHFTFSDKASADDVNQANILFNSSITGTAGCWMFFDPNGWQLWLASDDGSSWQSAGTLGSSNTAHNSQCTVGGAQGGVSNPHSSGSDLVLTIPVTFSATFSGNKTIFMRGSNRAGFDSDYQTAGTWTVP